jgi:phosphate transport system substrate-binding protein
VTIPTSKRLGALAFAAAMVFGACTSTGASPSAPAPVVSQEPAASSSDSTAPGSPAVTAPEPATASITLQGAGATFPTPLYTKWFEDYGTKYSNVKIDYQSIGSGGGI